MCRVSEESEEREESERRESERRESERERGKKDTVTSSCEDSLALSNMTGSGCT